MKTKALILAILLNLTLQLKAQEEQEKFDFRIGSGVSLLGSGDMITLNVENEFNFKFSQYFSNSISVNYGRSNSGAYETASFIQGNINLYISPFRNNKRNDFRIGSGLSYYNVSDSYRQSSWYQDGQ